MAVSWDWLGVLLVTILSSLIIEFALWLTVYRHQSFQSLRTNLARQAKKLEEMKGVAVSGAKLKSKQKKESRLENSMKNDSAREFASLKLKQGLASSPKSSDAVMAAAQTAFIIFAAWRVIAAHYEGKVVAKLPFEPFSLLAKITRRGIEDNKDLTLCAWTFIFTLCQMGVRANITKALDLGPSRQMLGLSSLGAMAERADKVNKL